LKFYIWDCQMVALTGEDYDAFRKFGWSRGIGTLIYLPLDDILTYI
jgi:hypothetical protein